MATYNNKQVKDISCINADPAYSLFIDTNKKQVVQKANVIKISSFFGNNDTDNELRQVINFIKEDLREKNFNYDLRTLAAKYKEKQPKLH